MDQLLCVLGRRDCGWQNLLAEFENSVSTSEGRRPEATAEEVLPVLSPGGTHCVC